MIEERYELVVIGGGPAGEKGAVQAAYFGKRVALVERAARPGGAAVHTGTLPSKTLREAALYLGGRPARSLYGIAVELDREAMLPRLLARKDAIVDVAARVMEDNLARHGVARIRGAGRLVSPERVEVVDGDGGVTRVLHTDRVLLATGSRPRRPAGIDFDDPAIHDSDEVLAIPELPRELAVIGAGVIGCEYACMFAALGVRTVLIDPRRDVLSFLDDELVARLLAAMSKLGVRIALGAGTRRVARQGELIEVLLEDGTVFAVDQVLVAAGRTGCTADLGLDAVGVKRDERGHVLVDSAFRTSVPNVYAAGDVVGFPALASASMEQARVAVCDAFGLSYKTCVSPLVPYGIYTIPEVSGVGETEAGAKAKGLEVVVGRAELRENPRAMIAGDVDGLTKLVVERATRRVIGVHVVCERASELVHVGQAVMALGGSVDVFIDMVFNHPTLGESYKYAAYDALGRLARA